MLSSKSVDSRKKCGNKKTWVSGKETDPNKSPFRSAWLKSSLLPSGPELGLI